MPVEISTATARWVNSRASRVHTSTSRFGTRSLITPPYSENRSIEILRQALTQPSDTAEPVSSYTNHPCATPSIWNAASEVTRPSQYQRKSRLRSASKVPPCSSSLFTCASLLEKKRGKAR